MDTLNQIIFLVDQGSHQFRSIDGTAAHLQEMGAGFFHNACHQLIHVIDLADSGDSVCSVMGPYNQRLCFKIRNAADAQVALHVMDIIVKLGTERRVFNVVDGTVKAVFSIHRQSGPAGSQMGMVIRAEKQIKYAIFF